MQFYKYVNKDRNNIKFEISTDMIYVWRKTRVFTEFLHGEGGGTQPPFIYVWRGLWFIYTITLRPKSTIIKYVFQNVKSEQKFDLIHKLKLKNKILKMNNLRTFVDLNIELLINSINCNFINHGNKAIFKNKMYVKEQNERIDSYMVWNRYDNYNITKIKNKKRL